MRLLRPLKAMTNVKGLALMLSALFQSLPQLATVAMLLFFILFFFAVVGLQLFYGKFTNRCVDLNTGPSFTSFPFLVLRSPHAPFPLLCTGQVLTDRLCASTEPSEGLFSLDFLAPASCAAHVASFPNVSCLDTGLNPRDGTFRFFFSVCLPSLSLFL
jgi:hypothetical protein